MSDDTNPQFERVYTVHDWYDGPRAGFADFAGHPHAYVARWREDLDDWESEYQLSPISAGELVLVLEDWAIWQRWERAFRAGETAQTTHPALPHDAERHAELAPQIARLLEADQGGAVRALGKFRATGGRPADVHLPSSERQLEVLWTVLSSV